MLRHLGLIAVCACLVASAGCEGGKVTAPAPDLNATVEFSGRVVNADAGGRYRAEFRQRQTVSPTWRPLR